MPLLANAQMTVSAAPGAGDVSLGAAAPGGQGWAAAGAADGSFYSYRIEEGGSWEIGLGRYVASGPSLVRATILASSSAGAAVNFGGGAIVSQVALPADILDLAKPFAAPTGSAGAPGYTFQGFPGIGFSAGSGFLAMSIAGNELQRTLATGNVGNLVRSPLEALHIARSAPLGGLNYAGIRIDLASNWGALFAGYLEQGVGGGAIIYTANSGAMVEALRIDQARNVRPGSDNVQSLGVPALRFSVLYAGTGTINTSDAREKTAVVSLTPAELAWSRSLLAEIGTFQFLAAVEKKRGAARLHIGLTVQRAIALGEACGLDPGQYAFICHDEWAATDETPAVPGQAAVFDDEGELVSNEVAARPAIPSRPAGDRYGFRADELALFLLRGIDARLSALEPDA